MIKIKSHTQPIENAEVFDIYSGGVKVAIRIIAYEGFELVKEGEEPTDIRSVDIPVLYEERVNSYKSILWVEKPEIKEPEIPEEPETEGNEEDYINALEEKAKAYDILMGASE